MLWNCLACLSSIKPEVRNISRHRWGAVAPVRVVALYLLRLNVQSCSPGGVSVQPELIRDSLKPWEFSFPNGISIGSAVVRNPPGGTHVGLGLR